MEGDETQQETVLSPAGSSTALLSTGEDYEKEPSSKRKKPALAQAICRRGL